MWLSDASSPAPPGLTDDHEASGVDRFVHRGKLAGAFGVEDNVGRMRQLGLST